jgi:uncharacterized protein (DUF1330 family)
MASAYVIVELSVTDAEAYERYKPLAAASVAAHGGAYRVRGGACECVEGEAVTDRFVVLEFPDLASARRWYHSPAYQQAMQIRLAAATTRRFFFVEGHEAPAAG